MIRKSINWLIPLITLVIGLWMASATSYARPDYTRRTKKECKFCHPSEKNWEINDAGRFYREHGYSLKDYKPPENPPQQQQSPAKH